MKYFTSILIVLSSLFVGGCNSATSQEVSTVDSPQASIIDTLTKPFRGLAQCNDKEVVSEMRKAFTSYMDKQAKPFGLKSADIVMFQFGNEMATSYDSTIEKRECKATIILHVNDTNTELVNRLESVSHKGQLELSSPYFRPTLDWLDITNTTGEQKFYADHNFEFNYAIQKVPNSKEFQLTVYENARPVLYLTSLVAASIRAFDTAPGTSKVDGVTSASNMIVFPKSAEMCSDEALCVTTNLGPVFHFDVSAQPKADLLSLKWAIEHKTAMCMLNVSYDKGVSEPYKSPIGTYVANGMMADTSKCVQS